MKPSQIMRKAADEFLWDGRRHMPKGKHEYVADAVLYVAEGFCATDHSRIGVMVMEILDAAGLRIPTLLTFGEQRQSARFMFLHLLALVLEEEGQ